MGLNFKKKESSMKLLSYAIVPACMFVVGLSAHAYKPRVVPLTTVVKNSDGKNILADSFMRTLYVFDSDQNQPMPVCEATCAELWPPYLLTEDEVAAVKAPLGTVVRKNGKVQLTYNGRAVYTWAYDRTKGDDTGDMVENLWHIVEVPGKMPILY
jgi:predicted lipoprotein with Yx(FWY)xxD motif